MKNNFKVGDVVKRVRCANPTAHESGALRHLYYFKLGARLGVGDYGVVEVFDDLNMLIKVSNGFDRSTWYNIKDFELSDITYKEKPKGIHMKPDSYSESKHTDVNHHLGVNIKHLIMLTEQKSFKMPSELTREERRAWAKNNQQNHTWDDVTMPSFLLYIEEQTPAKETLEKSLEDTVKLHEDKLREEVKQHRDIIEKDTRGAYQFFLNNEDDIIYKLKMINRPVSKSELIKYHQSIFPKLDEKLFGRLLMRKGYIFSTPRYKHGQPFGLVDWLFWCVMTCLICAWVLSAPFAILGIF